MSQDFTARGSRRKRAIVVSFAAAAIAAMCSWTPATAHAQLVSASPARDENVNTVKGYNVDSLTSVILTFDERVSTVGETVISVVGPDGTAVDEGDTKVDGAVVSVRLQPLTVEGNYTVTYRVVSDDGHIVNDSYSFSIGFINTPVDGAIKTPDATASPMLGMSPTTTTATATNSKASEFSLVKVAVVLGFVGIYFVVARWLKAYRSRLLDR